MRYPSCHLLLEDLSCELCVHLLVTRDQTASTDWLPGLRHSLARLEADRGPGTCQGQPPSRDLSEEVHSAKMLGAEASADGAVGALPGQDLGEPRQEERLHRGNFRRNNACLRLTELLCLKTFIAGISRRDYTMGLDPREPSPLFYRAGTHLQAKTWSHFHRDHP